MLQIVHLVEVNDYEVELTGSRHLVTGTTAVGQLFGLVIGAYVAPQGNMAEEK